MLENSLTKLTSKNIIYTYGIKGLSYIISLIYVPLLLNCLDEKLYGIWLTITSVIAWLGICDIGIGNGLKNKLTEALSKNNLYLAKNLVSTAYVYSFCIFTVVAILGLIINSFLHWNFILNTESDYNKNIQVTAAVVIIVFCMRFVLQLITPILTATQKIHYSSMLELCGQILALIGVYILNYLHINSLAIFSIVTLGLPLLVYFLYSFYFFSNQLKHIKPQISCCKSCYFKDIFTLGVKFFIIQIAAVIIFQTNSVLIANSFGPEDVTKYNIVYKLFSIAVFGWGIILNAMWPSYTQSYVKNDLKWIKKMIKYCLCLFIITIILAVLVTVYCSDILIIWLHRDIGIPQMLSITMLIYTLVSIWNSIWGTVVGAISKVRLGTITTTISAILFIPLFYFFKSYNWGVSGAVMSMVICILISAVVSPLQTYYFVYKKNKTILWTRILS